MGLFSKIIFALALLYGGLYLLGFFSSELPPLDPGEGWWGREEKSVVGKEDVSIRPFRVSFSKDSQEDLKRRLNSSRYFDSLEGTDWSYGTSADYMREFVDYWLKQYSWEKQEKIFNQFKHYKTKIEGIDIHFVHVKPAEVKPGQKVKPILMVHGWPGSFYEFYKVIPMLTNPTKYGGTDEDVFEVICPSLPGFGFSEAAHRPGFDPRDAARIFHTLMNGRLGFGGYYVQGGDWGSYVVETMSLYYPKFVLGHHSNFVRYQPPLMPLRILIGSICPCLVLSSEADQEKIFPFGDYVKRTLVESGYFHIQATKPDTIGHALTDSPIGLAAYILEKFSFSTDPDHFAKRDGGVAARFTTDDLLNNVMVYWISGSITSSMRLYKELADNVGIFDDPLTPYPVLVPTAFAVFPYEAVRCPEPWLHYKYKDLVSYTDMPDGGHFPALEQPKLLVDDIRQFVRQVEKRHVD